MAKKRKEVKMKKKVTDIVKVVLKPTEVLQVEVPPAHIPVVVPDPVRSNVQIVAIKQKKRSWWSDWLG